MNFVDYSDIGFEAFEKSLKQTEIKARKKEVIDQVIQHYRTRVESVLFIGFNPAALDIKNSRVFFTQVSDSAKTALDRKSTRLNSSHT